MSFVQMNLKAKPRAQTKKKKSTVIQLLLLSVVEWEILNFINVLLGNVLPCYHVSYILAVREEWTHVFWKANQCNHKDTESAVADADLAHVQCTRYSI